MKRILFLLTILALWALPAVAAQTTAPICTDGVYDPDNDACAVTGTISEPANATAVRDIDIQMASRFYRNNGPNSIHEHQYRFQLDSESNTWTLTASDRVSGSGTAPTGTVWAKLYKYNGSGWSFVTYGTKNYSNQFGTFTATKTETNEGTKKLTAGSYAVASFDTTYFGALYFDLDDQLNVSNVHADDWDGSHEETLVTVGEPVVSYSCDAGKTLNGDQCEYIGTSYVAPTCPQGFVFKATLDACERTAPPGPVEWGASGLETGHVYRQIMTY